LREKNPNRSFRKRAVEKDERRVAMEILTKKNGNREKKVRCLSGAPERQEGRKSRKRRKK